MVTRLDKEKTYYTVSEVVKILNLSIITIRRFIKDKKNQGFYKMGKEWRIEKEHLEKFINKINNNK